MQASNAWAPPGGTLGRILEDTRKRLLSLEGDETGIRTGSPSLRQALVGDSVAVIAEVKRKSPSVGVLNSALDAARQAGDFARGGAAAISVLTEARHFGGSIADLEDVRAVVDVPILQKDFHIARAQLVQAAAAGASAVLLIARALSPEELPRLIDAAAALGIEALVEVRTEDELERALDAGSQMIGVNARNLETLEVDERVPERLVPLVPAGLVAIWESGVQSVDDVQRAARCGADAVLVGSALSRASHPIQLLADLKSVPRRGRRG